MSGVLVDPEKYGRYKALMETIEANFQLESVSHAERWWAIHLIYAEELWKLDGSTWEEWLADFSTRHYGCAKSAFYIREKQIKRWAELGWKEDKIKAMLSSNASALISDASQLYDKNGLKEEVVKQLEANNTTEEALYEQAAQLGPGEARKHIGEYLAGDKIYMRRDAAALPDGTILGTLRWETRDGEILEFAISISGRMSSPEKKEKTYLPEECVKLLCKLLKVEVN
jgi:hypothetical protein